MLFCSFDLFLFCVQLVSGRLVTVTFLLPLRTASWLEQYLLFSRPCSCSVGFMFSVWTWHLIFANEKWGYYACFQSVWFASRVWREMLNLGGTDGNFNVMFFRRCWATRLRAVAHLWPRWHIWRRQRLHRNSQFGCVCKICFEDDLSAGEDITWTSATSV